MKLFQVYLETLRDEHNLSAFWMSYLDMAEIMLALIRAPREGNWMLHLGAIQQMIPMCFAYDKVNYARFLTNYYAMYTQRSTITSCMVALWSISVSIIPLGGLLWSRPLKRRSTKTPRRQGAEKASA